MFPFKINKYVRTDKCLACTDVFFDIVYNKLDNIEALEAFCFKLK